MTSGMLIFLGILVVIVIFSFLKAEKLVKLTFGTYVVLGVVMGLGMLMEQYAGLLNQNPELVFLGISHQEYARFLINAQPTVLLIFAVLLLWFFTQYAYLSVKLSEDLTERKLQTGLWAFFAFGSQISFFFLLLSYFKGAVYDWIFSFAEIAMYRQHLPLFCLLITLLVLIFSSKFPFKLGIQKEPEVGL